MTISKPKTAGPKDHPWPDVNEQGYPQPWYDHIVATTGDRYLVPATSDNDLHATQHEMNKRRVLQMQ